MRKVEASYQAGKGHEGQCEHDHDVFALMTRHSLGVDGGSERSIDVEVRAKDEMTGGSAYNDCEDEVRLHGIKVSPTRLRYESPLDVRCRS